MEKILKILKKTYPKAKCTLNYTSPWELLVAVILSAQCTDKRVNLTTPELFKKYPTPEKVANANRKDIEEIIKPTGFFHNKAKAIQEAAKELKGNVPQTLKELTHLRGVGRKTANVVQSIAFKKAEGIAVDVHVARISKRVGWTKNKTPEKIEKDLMQIIPKKEWVSITNILIEHGRTVCKAPIPQCSQCPLTKLCPKINVTKHL